MINSRLIGASVLSISQTISLIDTRMVELSKNMQSMIQETIYPALAIVRSIDSILDESISTLSMVSTLINDAIGPLLDKIRLFAEYVKEICKSLSVYNYDAVLVSWADTVNLFPNFERELEINIQINAPPNELLDQQTENEQDYDFKLKIVAAYLIIIVACIVLTNQQYFVDRLSFIGTIYNWFKTKNPLIAILSEVGLPSFAVPILTRLKNYFFSKNED